eukprot:4081293-Pyramimonas_sp.AAC.2
MTRLANTASEEFSPCILSRPCALAGARGAGEQAEGVWHREEEANEPEARGGEHEGVHAPPGH